MPTVTLSAPRDTPQKDIYVLQMGQNMHRDGINVFLPLDHDSITRGFSPHAHFQIVARRTVAFYVPYVEKLYENNRAYINQIKMTHAAHPSLPILVPTCLLKGLKDVFSGQNVSLHGYDDDFDFESLRESIKNLSSCRKVFFMPAPL